MFFSRRVHSLLWLIDLSRSVVGLLIEKWSRGTLHNVTVTLMHMISVAAVSLKLFVTFELTPKPISDQSVGRQ